MTKTVSKFISVIFHPLIMPAAGLFIILNSNTYLTDMPYEMKKGLYMIIIAGTLVFPLLVLPLYFLFNIIENVEMSSRKERIIPLLTTAVVYFLVYRLLYNAGVPDIIYRFLLGSFIAVCIALAVSFFWKISLHMVGAGGVIGLVLGLSLIFSANFLIVFVLCIFCAGILGTARLLLNAHDSYQVGAGAIVGIAAVLGAMVV